MSIASIIKKVGGGKFLLGAASSGVCAYLATRGVPPEASWPVATVVLGTILGIAAEDVAKVRAEQSKADIVERAIKALPDLPAETVSMLKRMVAK